MTVRLKGKITLEFEYDANPEHYNTSDPVQMAAIDVENWKVYPEEEFASFLEDNELQVEIKPA